uniref:Uncharacterized protein n=1 Tax=Sciurus vulgaris TaxID=55149 RepID=A0A8D2AVH4_SCIVU
MPPWHRPVTRKINAVASRSCARALRKAQPGFLLLLAASLSHGRAWALLDMSYARHSLDVQGSATPQATQKLVVTWLSPTSWARLAGLCQPALPLQCPR